MHPYWSKVGSKSNVMGLIRRGDTQRHTQNKDDRVMEAETGPTGLQTEGHQEPPGEMHKRTLPWSLQTSTDLLMPLQPEA